MYIDNLYISHYILCIQLYVYIIIYIYCTVVYIRIKSSTMGLVDKSHDKWVGSPVCIQALSGVIFVQEMMTNHWIWMASAADGAPSPQGIPLVESKLSHNYETVQDSTRPRTCISALSFLTLRPGLIHGRARERALDPNLTSFRNYEARKSCSLRMKLSRATGHILAPCHTSNCQLTSHLALFIISTWSVMVPWFPTTVCRFQHCLALVFKCWDILYINFACGVPFQSRDCEAVCANLGASSRSKLTMLGQTFWIQISI